MRLLALAVLMGCAASRELTQRDINAYCAILAFRIGQDTTKDGRQAVIAEARRNGVVVEVKGAQLACRGAERGAKRVANDLTQHRNGAR